MKNRSYRDLCQVFTPQNIVEQMLDWCDYKKDLYGKRVLENSCGDGNILIQVVDRYIRDCIKSGYSLDKIKNGLNHDIYAFETDVKQYEKCKTNLNNITEKYSVFGVEWDNIKNEDALKAEPKEKFDYVIGNPPYIKYKSLKEEDREYVKNNFLTCKKGKFDYCYAFIEKAINSLSDSGKMIYLIPSSIFKNVFADDLRRFIKPYLVNIYDYTTEKLFDGNTNEKGELRLTSSCVMIIDKAKVKKYITYCDLLKDIKIKIDKKDLEGKWIFDNQNNVNNNILGLRRFGDFFKASNTIATLYNKAYVIDINQIEREDESYIYLKSGEKIEREIIRPSASPRNLQRELQEIIIFPYKSENEKILRYEESEFESNFPNAVRYLRKNYDDELQKRKSDKNARWYEYGRSQAVENSNRPKLLVSTVITKRVNVYPLPGEVVPYSGIYIQPIAGNNLDEARAILESDEFFAYIEKIGIHASGESYRITSKDINNYEF